MSLYSDVDCPDCNRGWTERGMCDRCNGKGKLLIDSPDPLTRFGKAEANPGCFSDGYDLDYGNGPSKAKTATQVEAEKHERGFDGWGPGTIKLTVPSAVKDSPWRVELTRDQAESVLRQLRELLPDVRVRDLKMGRGEYFYMTAHYPEQALKDATSPTALIKAIADQAGESIYRAMCDKFERGESHG